MPVRDAVYDFVAHHRYQWFGKTNQCQVGTDCDSLQSACAHLLTGSQCSLATTSCTPLMFQGSNAPPQFIASYRIAEIVISDMSRCSDIGMQVPDKSILERCLDAQELIAARAGVVDHDTDDK